MKKLILLLLFLATPAIAKEVVPFIDNDYAKALAQAKKANLPIFVAALLLTITDKAIADS